jgi:UDP-N-acetylglucosamine--dolichyl-phosphate N-acetylglucosaminephosphotransferase
VTDFIIIIPILSAFFITLFLTPIWVRKAKQIDLMWEDMHKPGSEKVAGSGGIIAVGGFILGMLIYIAYTVFILKSHNSYLIESFAIISVILLVSGLGFVDDLLGWRRGGLSKRSRLLFLAFASIPLIAINAGRSFVGIPFFGQIDLGLIYPLFLIPLGIIGSTFTFNFLAGYNGLEAGQGILVLSALGLVAYLTGSSWLTVVAIIMIASLIAFLFHNFNPASVFPGDSLTYSVGGLIAIMAILGNFERIAVFFFIPYILETGLKLRGKLVKQSFGKPNEKGELDLKYNKIYGLEHLSIVILKKVGIRSTEKNVVFLIWAFQILIIVLGFIIFRGRLFT